MSLSPGQTRWKNPQKRLAKQDPSGGEAMENAIKFDAESDDECIRVVTMIGARVSDRKIAQLWMGRSEIDAGTGELVRLPGNPKHDLLNEERSPDQYVSLPPGYVAIGWGVRARGSAITDVKIIARVWDPVTRTLGEDVHEYQSGDGSVAWDVQVRAQGKQEVLTGIAAHLRHASRRQDDFVNRIAGWFASLETPQVPVPPKLNDDEDERLLRHYAPLVWLYPTESVFPCSVEYFFERGKVTKKRKTLVSPIGTSEPLGGSIFVQDDDLPAAVKKAKKGEDKAHILAREAYKLELLENHKTPRDILGERMAPVYCYRQRLKNKGDVIQWDVFHYFFFYLYNPGPPVFGDTGDRAGAHECDWEQIMIRTPAVKDPSNPPRPDRVYLASHSGGNAYEWSKMETFTHPNESHARAVVYAAEGSHATYRSAGKQIRFPLNDDTGRGWAWATWQRVTDIGWAPWGYKSEANFTMWQPKNQQLWVKYYGEWGEVTGPTHNADWELEDLEGKKWPARER